MKEFVEQYYRNVKDLIDSVEAGDNKGSKMDFKDGVETACRKIKECNGNGKKLIFIGNGASAAISSHQATDFWKNGGMRAIAFNDASLLTCVSNDIGYEFVFEKPVDMFADKGDILIAISSSGRSENILRGVKAAREKECGIISLSGFDENNPLRTMGDLNFYVPSNLYGHVEILHHSICHCILEYIIAGKEKWINTE